MKRAWAYVATLAVVALASLGAYSALTTPWQFDPAAYPRVVAWAGCTARVVADDAASPAESFYVPGAHVIVVGTHEDRDLPYYAGLFILFHETGHCLQAQDGTMDRLWGAPLELDADRRASDLACGLGLDGRQIAQDTWDWAQRELGYNGDHGHGTLAERRAQAANAHACDRPEPQRWAAR